MTYKPHPGYVPVEPDTGIVHDNGPDIDHTLCGKRLTWCKSIMFVGDDNDWCPTCWPGTEMPLPPYDDFDYTQEMEDRFYDG